MNEKIKAVHARQVFDSRGNPTVEVEVSTGRNVARAIVPSGASTGVHEAVELRDGGKAFLGKGVTKAVRNVNTLLSKLVVGRKCTEQKQIDAAMIELDASENKSRLGANAILGVSMAVCKAGAMAKNMALFEHIASIAGMKEYILPVPSMNVINGGKHAGNELDIQEYMIIPVGADSFSHAMQMCTEVYHHLKKIIQLDYGVNAVNVGDEGGFAPPLKHPEEPIELILKAISEAGYSDKIRIAIDSAASEFFKQDKYFIDGKELSGAAMVSFYRTLVEKYPVVSIEDPFSQEDFENFSRLTEEIGEKVQIVGDDLLVTNPKRIRLALEKNSCNALLLKVNQIGTVTEAIEAALLAKKNGWSVMVSHRSGETEDPFIADLAVGIRSGQIKSGAPCRSERLAKYNQLLRIEEALGDKAVYAGEHFRRA